MGKVTWKGSTQLAPLPAVLVTCGNEEKKNILTVAWTGIINSQPPRTYVSIRPERYSYNIIKESKEFVINVTTEDLGKAVDYCGVKSGKNEDKFLSCNLKTLPGETVSCPILEDSPLSLECKVFDIIELGSHTMFLADITAIRADDRYINKDGKFDLSKPKLLTYLHGEYHALGKLLGTFGWAVKKKNKSRKSIKNK